MQRQQKGVSRSAADKIIDSISDELLIGSRRFMYGRSYAMLLGALRKHLAIGCVAMGLSERFDYIVSIFSEGSPRRFSDCLDADISMRPFIPLRGSSGTPYSFRALRASIGLEGFVRGAKVLVCARVLRMDAGSWMRRKCQTGLLRKWDCCTSVSLAPAKRCMSPLLCSA